MVQDQPSNDPDTDNVADPTNEHGQLIMPQAQDLPPNIMGAVWQPNQPLLDGRYIIEKLLGSGGFGVAYLAKDTQLKRDVVIKNLKKNLQDDPLFRRFQEDFVAEGRRLSKCNHAHIVKIYDIFQEGDLQCLVMEYIDGETLDNRISRLGRMKEEEALQYVRQISKALEVMHQNKLVHRDVKPGNIMIRQGTQEAILIDFGIAREFDLYEVIPQTAFVSEDYAPLEQYKKAAGKGPYTDVYALAGTLYFMLTGKKPQSARERSDHKNMDEEDPLIYPKQENPNISDRVNQAIITGLSLSPKKRPQSIQEWLILLTEGQPAPQLGNEEESTSSNNITSVSIETEPDIPDGNTPTTDQPVTRVEQNERVWVSLNAAITAAVSLLLANALLNILKPYILPPWYGYLSAALWLGIVVIVGLGLRLLGRNYQQFYWLTIAVSPTLLILSFYFFKIKTISGFSGYMAVWLTIIAAFLGFCLTLVMSK